MVQNYEVVGGMGHRMAPDHGNSEGDPRGNNKALRSKRSPDAAPKQTPNNHMLHRNKANAWQHDQGVVKEVLKLKDLRHEVTAGGKEHSQVTEKTLKLAVEPERDPKWVPMFELMKQYKAECGSINVPFD